MLLLILLITFIPHIKQVIKTVFIFIFILLWLFYLFVLVLSTLCYVLYAKCYINKDLFDLKKCMDWGKPFLHCLISELDRIGLFKMKHNRPGIMIWIEFVLKWVVRALNKMFKVIYPKHFIRMHSKIYTNIKRYLHKTVIIHLMIKTLSLCMLEFKME